MLVQQTWSKLYFQHWKFIVRLTVFSGWGKEFESNHQELQCGRAEINNQFDPTYVWNHARTINANTVTLFDLLQWTWLLQSMKISISQPSTEEPWTRGSSPACCRRVWLCLLSLPWGCRNYSSVTKPLSVSLKKVWACELTLWMSRGLWYQVSVWINGCHFNKCIRLWNKLELIRHSWKLAGTFIKILKVWCLIKWAEWLRLLVFMSPQRSVW